jgi:hypothetical protein
VLEHPERHEARSIEISLIDAEVVANDEPQVEAVRAFCGTAAIERSGLPEECAAAHNASFASDAAEMDGKSKWAKSLPEPQSRPFPSRIGSVQLGVGGGFFRRRMSTARATRRPCGSHPVS